MNSNEIWRTWKKVKNKSYSLSKFWWLSSLSLHNWYILIDFLPSLHLNFFWFWNIPNHYWKNTQIHSVDAELAGHACKLDVKLQSLCGNVFSVCCAHCACLAKPYHLGGNWPTTHCEMKDEVHFFTLNFECHNRYKKLSLCNSENSDIAWWDKNNSESFFFVFCKKRTKSYFFLQKTENVLKNKTGGIAFFEKKQVFLNSGHHGIRTPWKTTNLGD